MPISNIFWLLFIVAISGVILTGSLSAGLALFIGLIAAVSIDNPFAAQCRRYSTHCLKVAIVCVGFGMNISLIGQTALGTFWITLCTIIVTFLLAWLISKPLLVEKNTTMLIGSGTAICGGSAIAAVSQVLKAKPEQITIAVTTVFILNMIALYLFPIIGRWFELTEYQFGIWAALAIHDTSSVVGAATDFGPQALEVATTTKLARALWILPLTIIGALMIQRGENKAESTHKIVLPLFILLFVAASIINSLLSDFSELFLGVASIGKNLLVMALFLLGLGFTKSIFQQIDKKAFILGALLWICISIIALTLVVFFY